MVGVSFIPPDAEGRSAHRFKRGRSADPAGTREGGVPPSLPKSERERYLGHRPRIDVAGRQHH
jgi:hypothetical protein